MEENFCSSTVDNLSTVEKGYGQIVTPPLFREKTVPVLYGETATRQRGWVQIVFTLEISEGVGSN